MLFNNLLSIMKVFLNLFLSLWIGYYSVNTMLILYAAPLPNLPTMHATQQSSPALPKQYETNLTSADVQNIIKAFGAEKIRPVKTSAPVITNPIPSESKLNSNLQGIYYSTNPNNSFVIIEQKRYKITDAIQPNVYIEDIQPKHIILRRNNQLEILYLRPQESKLTSKILSNPDTQTTGKLLATYQSQLRNNPQALLHLARIQPAYDGAKFVGYSINPGTDKSLLTHFDLQEGDIITSVNGIELDSPIKGLNLWQQLPNAKQLQLNILRNGRTQTLNFMVD